MILIYSLWILPLENELDLQRFVIKFGLHAMKKAGFMYNVKIVV